MVHRADPHLARRPSWPNMILDDGGDATLLVHKGVEFSKAGEVPEPTEDDSEEFQVILKLLKRSIAEGYDWTAVANEHQGRHRGDHHRRPPAVRDASQRCPAVPGHQRQRLGDQVQVRQQVRLSALPDRRHEPGHRRADRRQGRGRLRVRRRRQGLRGVAPRPGRPGGHHRDRPDLRAAGGDGRLPGAHPGGRAADRRHLRHRHRLLQRHLGRPDGADEAPGDRGQHRPLRQRDRHGRTDQDPGRPADQHQAAGRPVDLRRRHRRCPHASSCSPRAG